METLKSFNRYSFKVEQILVSLLSSFSKTKGKQNILERECGIEIGSWKDKIQQRQCYGRT